LFVSSYSLIESKTVIFKFSVAKPSMLLISIKYYIAKTKKELNLNIFLFVKYNKFKVDQIFFLN